MQMANHEIPARAAQRMEANRAELTERIAEAVQVDGVVDALPGLHLGRASIAGEPVHSVIKPSFCVIVQGSKEVLLGDNRYVYDPAHYLLATLDLPRTSRILQASPDCPYLSLALELDPALVSSVMAETGHGQPSNGNGNGNGGDVRALDVSPLDVELQDAVVRLVRLVDTPAEARILLPLIQREIVYRLLVGHQGARLRHLAVGGNTSHIVKAVERLRQDFNQPLRVEQLARELGMSVSGFHHHFKAVTALSPMQFQKRLRLQEARRLMLGEGLDAASAAYRVGYQDASYFNREYKSLFGDPPMRDVQRLREATGVYS